MLEISHPNFEDLTEEEKRDVPNNGNGKEYASYIKVMYGGETICLKSDAMEPEDKTFYRDLKWIGPMIAKAYELGKQDA